MQVCSREKERIIRSCLGRFFMHSLISFLCMADTTPHRLLYALSAVKCKYFNMLYWFGGQWQMKSKNTKYCTVSWNDYYTHVPEKCKALIKLSEPCISKILFVQFTNSLCPIYKISLSDSKTAFFVLLKSDVLLPICPFGWHYAVFCILLLTALSTRGNSSMFSIYCMGHKFPSIIREFP